jgi:hypothetical protein
MQIKAVRKKAAAYIVEALEQGGSVYRLFHERAAEVLAEQYLRPPREGKTAQEAIVAALVSLVPPLPGQKMPDWPQAHPYLLSHLAAHAAKAGRLQEQAADQLFLAACDPTRLRPTLQAAAEQDADRPDAEPLREIAATMSWPPTHCPAARPWSAFPTWSSPPANWGATTWPIGGRPDPWIAPGLRPGPAGRRARPTSASTPHLLCTPLPSARTDGALFPVLTTTPCACGMRVAASPLVTPFKAIQARCVPWPSVRTGSTSFPALKITLCVCGMG